jgi:hypothetical protein
VPEYDCSAEDSDCTVPRDDVGLPQDTGDTPEIVDDVEILSACCFAAERFDDVGSPTSFVKSELN